VKKQKHTQAITNWPLKERPRERLLAEGPERMTDAVLAGYSINERERKAVQFLKINKIIENLQYQKEFLISKNSLP
jgi:hypothetical protein